MPGFSYVSTNNNSGGGGGSSFTHHIVQGKLEYVAPDLLSIRPVNGNYVYNGITGDVINLTTEPHFILGSGDLIDQDVYNVFLNTGVAVSGSDGFRLEVNQSGVTVTNGISHMTDNNDMIHMGWCVPSGGLFEDNSVNRLVASRYHAAPKQLKKLAIESLNNDSNDGWVALPANEKVAFIRVPKHYSVLRCKAAIRSSSSGLQLLGIGIDIGLLGSAQYFRYTHGISTGYVTVDAEGYVDPSTSNNGVLNQARMVGTGPNAATSFHVLGSGCGLFGETWC